MLKRVFTLLVIITASMSLGSCTVKTEVESSNYNFIKLASQAKLAVEEATQTDLSDIEWEVASGYRFSRLAFRTVHEIYRVNISNPAVAREMTYVAVQNSSNSLLGLYKPNLKKIFIRKTKIINNSNKLSGFEYKLNGKEINCRFKLLNKLGEPLKCKEYIPRKLEDDIYLALFIHEYTHAADDKRLASIINIDGYQEGRSEVYNTLLEGHAEYLSEKLCKQLRCEKGFQYLEKKETDFSHIKSKKEKRYAKHRQDNRIFTYNEGKKLVDNIYFNSQAEDPIKDYVKDLPDSRMVVIYPELKDKLNQRKTTTLELLSALKSLKPHFPVSQWLHKTEVVQPPRMYRILKRLSRDSFRVKRQAPYLQSALLTLEKLDLFNIYNDAEKDLSNYFVIRDFGSEENSKSVFLQEKKTLNDKISFFDGNISAEILPNNIYQSYNFSHNTLKIDTTISMVQKGSFILIASTDDSVFKSNHEIAKSVKHILGALP